MSSFEDDQANGTLNEGTIFDNTSLNLEGGATALMPLSDTRQIILSSISLVTGTLSVLGSSLIVFMVFSSPQKTPYKRILLGLSITDAIASITFAIAPFLLPAESSHRIWAVGTDNTCSFLGVLYQLSFCAIWYNGMLSFYYLLTIRFGVSQTKFARRYEPWLHAVSIGFCLITAVAGLPIDLYSELDIGQSCWISEYPEGCQETNDCTGPIIAWAIGGVPGLFMFLSIIINNLVIFGFVRNTTRRLENFGGPGSGVTSQQNERVNAVATQAFFYVIAFFVSYIWLLLLRIVASAGYTNETQLYPLLILDAIFHPLQGVTNCFVYSRPNYLRNRQQFPEKSRWWALKRVWFQQRVFTQAPQPPQGQASFLGGPTEWFTSKTTLGSSSHRTTSSHRRNPSHSNEDEDHSLSTSDLKKVLGSKYPYPDSSFSESSMDADNVTGMASKSHAILPSLDDIQEEEEINRQNSDDTNVEDGKGAPEPSNQLIEFVDEDLSGIGSEY